jgi:phospholipid/cholesterol/gamma-HCH transport system substrate-binding protein
MENKHIATKVGLFVAIGLVLIASVVILFSKGASIFQSTYNLRLHASNVGGLKPQAGVLLAGVRVGSVSDIELADDGKSVTILLKIDNRYKNKIYHDAKFVIEQQGFLGDNYVSVISTSNTPPVLANNDEVECQEPFNLQEVARGAAGFIQRIDVVAKKLDDSVSEMQRVVLNAETMTNFAVSVENMRSFSEQAMGAVGQINQIIATNGTQVGLAVSNVLLTSGDFHALMTTNGETFTTSMKNIETSTEILTNLMTQLQSGKGLAGTVLQNQELATNVQAIANNLAVASSNLNKLGLWGFMWHKEKPKAVAPK